MLKNASWAVLALALAATPSWAQIFVAPPPVVVYRPPVVAPVPVQYSYYPPAAPVYYPPTTSYYAAPATSYYAPATTAYYPGSVTTNGVVTTESYRGFGIFRPRGWTSYSYYTPTGVVVNPPSIAVYP